MQTRREFLCSAAVGLAAIGLEPLAFAKKMDRPLGVQLYTVRSLMDDLPGTLRAIRKMGYSNVETYVAEYKMSAKDLRAAIVDAGLTVPSAHFGYNDFDSRFDYSKELGAECIVCAMVPLTIANSADGYKRGADQYNAWGAKAKAMGMKFGFHNHNVEFKEYGGTTGLEILLKNTDPSLVQWQMDCYWVTQAGHDPVAMLRQYGHRVQSLHVKDRIRNAPISLDTGSGSEYFTEVGLGTLDWTTILRLTGNDHVPYLFVEQDKTERPPLESLQISYDNLVKLLNRG
ncbi:MAG TPA: sugar phosphate isomerase/epimerase [Terracidiphilus sp.]|nr:sugar phosphate isomerase/epimerase [Terracidiphilus sp.]